MQVLLPGKADEQQKPWPCLHSLAKVIAADTIGAAALGILFFLLALILRQLDLSRNEWLCIYLVFAVSTIGAWHVSNFPRATPIKELKNAICTIFAGAICFLIDILGGHFMHPQLPLLKAGTTAGTPFGFLFTLAVCPAGTFCCIASAARTLFLHRESQCDA